MSKAAKSASSSLCWCPSLLSPVAGLSKKSSVIHVCRKKSFTNSVFRPCKSKRKSFFCSSVVGCKVIGGKTSPLIVVGASTASMFSSLSIPRSSSGFSPSVCIFTYSSCKRASSSLLRFGLFCLARARPSRLAMRCCANKEEYIETVHLGFSESKSCCVVGKFPPLTVSNFHRNCSTISSVSQRDGYSNLAANRCLATWASASMSVAHSKYDLVNAVCACTELSVPVSIPFGVEKVLKAFITNSSAVCCLLGSTSTATGLRCTCLYMALRSLSWVSEGMVKPSNIGTRGSLEIRCKCVLYNW